MSDSLDFPVSANHTAAMRRVAPRSVLAAYGAHLPSIGGLGVTGALYLLRPELWPGAFAWVIVGPLLLVRLVGPVIHFVVVRFRLTEHGIDLETRLLTRRRRSMRWRDVDTLNVYSPWSYRILELTRVRIAQSGAESGRIDLNGVDSATLAAIRALTTRPALEVVPQVNTSQDVSSSFVPRSQPEDLIFRATIGQLFLAGAIHGQFVFVGVGALFAVREWLDQIGWADGAQQTIVSSPALIGATGASIAVVGLVGTFVRAAGFEVRRHPKRGIVVASGFFSHRERTIRTGAVVGISLRRNIPELLLGRARLVLVTTDEGEEISANLILPSLPVSVVRRVLVETSAHYSTGDSILTEGRFHALTSLLVALASVIPGILVWWALFASGMRHGLTLIAVLGATTAFVYALGRLASTRMTVAADNDSVISRTRYISRRELVISVSALHSISVAAVLGRALWVRVSYYAGSARTLTSPLFDAGEIDRLRRKTAEVAPSVAADHLRRARSTT